MKALSYFIGLHSVSWHDCISYKKNQTTYCYCKRQFLSKWCIFNL